MKSHKQRLQEHAHLAKIKAEHKKQFFSNIKRMLNLVCGYDAFADLNQKFIDLLYDARFYKLKIVGKIPNQLNNSELQTLNSYCKQRFSTILIDIHEGGEQMPLSILVEEGFTLVFAMHAAHKYLEGKGLKMIQKFLDWESNTDFQKRLIEAIATQIKHMGIFFSSFYEGFLLGEYQVKLLKERTKISNVIEVWLEKAPISYFTIEKISRPAMQVVSTLNEGALLLSRIKPQDIGIPIGVTNAATIEVFIQSHALHRLDERLGLDVTSMHFCIFTAFEDIVYHYDDNGRLLIEYRYLYTKVGYLVCTYTEGKLLIQSFLFLTFNSTPEGKKLFELTGLDKIDKKYLAIDNLKSLLSYNIEKNEFVRNIFETAGCGQLFTMKNTIEMIEKAKNGLVDPKIIEEYLVKAKEVE